MHRTFLVSTIAALAGFATAGHARDGAAPRSTASLPHAAPARAHAADPLAPPRMKLAKLDGRGELYQPCHATYRDREVAKGHYDTVNGNDLACHDSREWILCHPDDTSADAPLCVDGYKD